jgi:hypothetical protein
MHRWVFYVRQPKIILMEDKPPQYYHIPSSAYVNPSLRQAWEGLQRSTLRQTSSQPSPPFPPQPTPPSPHTVQPSFTEGGANVSEFTFGPALNPPPTTESGKVQIEAYKVSENIKNELNKGNIDQARAIAEKSGLFSVNVSTTVKQERVLGEHGYNWIPMEYTNVQIVPTAQLYSQMAKSTISDLKAQGIKLTPDQWKWAEANIQYQLSTQGEVKEDFLRSLENLHYQNVKQSTIEYYQKYGGVKPFSETLPPGLRGFAEPFEPISQFIARLAGKPVHTQPKYVTIEGPGGKKETIQLYGKHPTWERAADVGGYYLGELALMEMVGVPAGAAAARGGAIISRAIPSSIQPTLQVGASRVAQVGLTGAFAGSTAIQIKDIIGAKEIPTEEKMWDITKMIAGGIGGGMGLYRGIQIGAGLGRTAGRTPISPYEITAPEIASGRQRFLYWEKGMPRGEKAAVKEFLRMSQKYSPPELLSGEGKYYVKFKGVRVPIERYEPEGLKPGSVGRGEAPLVYHTTGISWPKLTETLVGTSEVPGVYTAPGMSDFLRIIGLAEMRPRYKLFGWFEPSPTVETMPKVPIRTPPRGVKTPAQLRAWMMKQRGEYKGVLPYRVIPKAEAEAVIPPGVRLRRVTGKGITVEKPVVVRAAEAGAGRKPARLSPAEERMVETISRTRPPAISPVVDISSLVTGRPSRAISYRVSGPSRVSYRASEVSRVSRTYRGPSISSIVSSIVGSSESVTPSRGSASGARVSASSASVSPSRISTSYVTPPPPRIDWREIVGVPVAPRKRKGGAQPVHLRTRRWGVTDILKIAGVR